MIPQKYNDIQSKVENLYDTSSPQAFVAICDAALGGRRGLNKQELMSAMMAGNKGLIHAILSPLVDQLIEENRAEALATSSEYQIKSIGDNEIRVKKTERDKYQRTTGDYIVNTEENVCNCPESVNRLEKLFIPCKHQFLTSTITASRKTIRSLSAEVEHRYNIFYIDKENGQVLDVQNFSIQDVAMRFSDARKYIQSKIVDTKNPEWNFEINNLLHGTKIKFEYARQSREIPEEWKSYLKKKKIDELLDEYNKGLWDKDELEDLMEDIQHPVFTMEEKAKRLNEQLWRRINKKASEFRSLSIFS